MSRTLPTKRQKAERKGVKLRAPRAKRGEIKQKLLSRRNIEAIERRRKAMVLRRGGWEYPEIARELNVSPATVMEDVRYCLNLSATELMETTEEERELQKARLNAILMPNLKFATEYHNEIVRDVRTGKEMIVVKPPDPAFANVVLKIEERRSKLLALDKPETKKLEVSGIRDYVGIDMDQI